MSHPYLFLLRLMLLRLSPLESALSFAFSFIPLHFFKSDNEIRCRPGCRIDEIQSCTGRSNGNNNTEKEEYYLKIGLNDGLGPQGEGGRSTVQPCQNVILLGAYGPCKILHQKRFRCLLKLNLCLMLLCPYRC